MTRILCRILPALLAAFLCASCVDSREEIWLDPTGSGRAKITVTLPTSIITLRGGPDALRTMIGQLFSPIATVSDLRQDFSTLGSDSIIELSFRFASALSLLEELEKSTQNEKIPPALRHILGHARFQTKGLSFIAERRIDVPKAIPAARFLPASHTDHRFVTILHLPIKATTHNATRTEDHGKTLIWEMPLSSALQAPHIQRVVIRPPIRLIILLCSCLLLTATLTIWLVRKRRIKTRAQAMEAA